MNLKYNLPWKNIMSRYRLSKKWRVYAWEDDIWLDDYRKLLVSLILTLPLPVELIENILEHVPRGGFIHSKHIPKIFKDKLRKKKGILIDISGMLLKEVKFCGVHFPMININYSEFVECNFNNTLFRGCTITNCKFIRCTFHGSTLDKTSYGDCIFENCKFIVNDGGRLIYFIRCDMSHSIFSGMNLMSYNFTNCNMRGIQIKYCTLSNTSFSRCDLTESKLYIDKAYHGAKSKFEKCKIVNATINSKDICANFNECDFEDTVMEDVHFGFSNFIRCRFKKTSMTGSEFKFVMFLGNNLEGADFSYTTIDNILGIDPEEFMKVAYYDPDHPPYIE